MMPTLRTNSDLICLNGTKEIHLGGEKKEERISSPAVMIKMVGASSEKATAARQC